MTTQLHYHNAQSGLPHMIEVLVIDDHAIFRCGLRRLLADEPDIRVADEARNSTEALAKIRARRFDVVMLDITLEGRAGLDLIESVRAEFPSLPVLMLSLYPAEQSVLVGLRAGANGYVSKDTEPEELIQALRQIAAGGRYLAPGAQERPRGTLDPIDVSPPPHQKLSVREYEILLLIVKGMSLTEIAQTLFLSVKTISTYRTRILAKLGVDSNAALVLYAVRQGMIR
jgi:two-component system invasion response regulator UvrY